MSKITPCLWFDSQAEEAAHFYVSLLKNSKVGHISRYGDKFTEVTGKPAGSVMTVEFELNGQPYLALNGGPLFKFTEAVSFIINCDDQAEVDRLWAKLTADGGEESQCGWLKDKYGLSWQLIPKGFFEMAKDKDAKKVERMMRAVMQMRKLDLAVMKNAFEGKLNGEVVPPRLK